MVELSAYYRAGIDEGQAPDSGGQWSQSCRKIRLSSVLVGRPMTSVGIQVPDAMPLRQDGSCQWLWKQLVQLHVCSSLERVDAVKQALWNSPAFRHASQLLSWGYLYIPSFSLHVDSPTPSRKPGLTNCFLLFSDCLSNLCAVQTSCYLLAGRFVCGHSWKWYFPPSQSSHFCAFIKRLYLDTLDSIFQ